jgi:hypothetical protein
MPARTKKLSRSTKGHIDVQSKRHVGQLEKFLKNAKKSKTTVYVLVYMNGCGPCNRYKEEYWNDHVSQPGMYNKAASVHYDQLPYTSLNSAKLKGYPSVIEVKNGTLVDHPDEESPANFTNAMPSVAMRNLSKSPSPYSPSVSPSYNLSQSPLEMSDLQSNMNTSENQVYESPMNSPGSPMNSPGSPMNTSGSNMNTSGSDMNTSENQLPGNSGNSRNLSRQLSIPMASPSAGDSLLSSNKQRGGALLESMLAVAQDPKILTAALLTLTAAAAVSMKKKTRRGKRRGSRRQRK